MGTTIKKERKYEIFQEIYIFDRIKFIIFICDLRMKSYGFLTFS